MKTTNQIKSCAPGVVLSFIIATLACFIEIIIPVHLIGSSIIALFIGIGINHFWSPDSLKPGLKFTSKKILRIAIILLGSSLSITTIVKVGQLSLTVMFFTLLTCFGGGYFIGKALDLDWKLSNLISAGTGICGGSAIAAIAPVIDADDKDIAYAMSATFLFDMAMILLFPIMGHKLGLSDMAYGLWAGTAVNDTSSVVAAGYAYSEAAGDFATMVKLTRTLAIIPTVLVFAYINIKLKRRQANMPSDLSEKKVSIMHLYPWFIVGFLLLSALNSLSLIPTAVSTVLKEISKFFMVCALAAIGLNTSFSEMKKSGIAPMLHGFIISALVVIVAITVEYFMGIV
ncbi:MAG: putative sulfate exporter family transporter [Clostridia bacterium]